MSKLKVSLLKYGIGLQGLFNNDSNNQNKAEQTEVAPNEETNNSIDENNTTEETIDENSSN